MSESIVVSIASYRDVDLINTVENCILNANDPSRVFFSIHSQEEDDEHADLSFIPPSQLTYIKNHWSHSKGACWAREIANRHIDGFDYFLQIDSHSRFDKDWDNTVIDMYKKSSEFWGEIILSAYPNPFSIDPKTNEEIFLEGYDIPSKAVVYWSDEQNTLMSEANAPVVDLEYGDEVFYLSAGSIFCTVKTMQKLPYDKNLYFVGEEGSLALRAYTRGIKVISPPKNYMYSNYDTYPKRSRHWDDDYYWWEIEQKSHARLIRIMTGDKSLGVYGIKSEELFEQYQNNIGINLLEKYNMIEDRSIDLPLNTPSIAKRFRILDNLS